MTPEEKRELADLLLKTAVETAEHAAAMGLRDIPDGLLDKACSLADNPDNANTQWLIRNTVHDRIKLRMEELEHPAQNASEAKIYARREADLYNELLKRIFYTEGVSPDPYLANIQLGKYMAAKETELTKEGELLQYIDVAPHEVPVPSFSDICTANKAGKRL